MTAVGYARTRPGDNAAPKLAALTRAGCATVFLDEQVRLTDDWPQLDHALAAAPAGGTLIVCQLIRFAAPWHT